MKKSKTGLILYMSKTGHTRRAAEEVAMGMEASGIVTDLCDLRDGEPCNFADYHYLAFGSPTHGGKPARPLRKYVKELPKNSLKGKRVGFFTSYSAVRGGHTLRVFRKMLRKKGAKKIVPGVAVKAGSPLSLWKGSDIDAQGLDCLNSFGKTLASGK
ncbi:MAG: flavodoxin family protein [Candidatus Geothermincolia bacterium]